MEGPLVQCKGLNKKNLRRREITLLVQSEVSSACHLIWSLHEPTRKLKFREAWLLAPDLRTGYQQRQGLTQDATLYNLLSLKTKEQS